MDTFTAVVGAVQEVRSDGSARALVPLSQGFVMVPVDDHAWGEIGGELAVNEQARADLSVFFTLILRSCGLLTDTAGPLAFLEQDEYHQMVLVREGRTVVATLTTEFDEHPPLRAPGPEGAFNRGLRRIGVRTEGHCDECAALGLLL